MFTRVFHSHRTMKNRVKYVTKLNEIIQHLLHPPGRKKKKQNRDGKKKRVQLHGSSARSLFPNDNHVYTSHGPETLARVLLQRNRIHISPCSSNIFALLFFIFSLLPVTRLALFFFFYPPKNREIWPNPSLTITRFFPFGATLVIRSVYIRWSGCQSKNQYFSFRRLVGGDPVAVETFGQGSFLFSFFRIFCRFGFQGAGFADISFTFQIWQYYLSTASIILKIMEKPKSHYWIAPNKILKPQ